MKQKIRIEQPHAVKGDSFFFLKGWSHSGAEYGVTLTKAEVCKNLTKSAGIEIRMPKF